jgi:HD-GYP domain-containing protein (c-di-GMP phosphodiesterase class II)
MKPGRLTPDEFALMQAHTTIGERLCGELRSLRAVRAIVRHHHERIDGSGYPDRLRGDAIPLTAQIVAVVDAYDAMTTTRPYRGALSMAIACDELKRDGQEGRLNPDIVRVFVGMDRDAILTSGKLKRPA